LALAKVSASYGIFYGPRKPPWIPAGEQPSFLKHIAATESGSSCVPMKS